MNSGYTSRSNSASSSPIMTTFGGSSEKTLPTWSTLPTSAHAATRSTAVRRTTMRAAMLLALFFSLFALSSLVGDRPHATTVKGWFRSQHGNVLAQQAPLNSTKPARIVKVTAAYGKGAITEYGEKDVIALRERVLQTHIDHADQHGHRQYIQRSDMLQNIFTKAATILHVLLAEMAKPEAERSEWIWAHDSDMVLMNRNLNLEIFLPPAEKDYNLLVTYDSNGLNIGAFFMKVNAWSVELLSAVLGSQHLSFGSPGMYPDQDVMADLIQNVDYFREKAIEIPRRWINAFPTGWKGGYEDGDLLVHCVWWGKELLPDYLKTSESRAPNVNPLPEQFALGGNITAFWEGTLAKDEV